MLVSDYTLDGYFQYESLSVDLVLMCSLPRPCLVSFLKFCGIPNSVVDNKSMFLLDYATYGFQTGCTITALVSATPPSQALA